MAWTMSTAQPLGSIRATLSTDRMSTPSPKALRASGGVPAIHYLGRELHLCSLCHTPWCRRAVCWAGRPPGGGVPEAGGIGVCTGQGTPRMGGVTPSLRGLSGWAPVGGDGRAAGGLSAHQQRHRQRWPTPQRGTSAVTLPGMGAGVVLPGRAVRRGVWSEASGTPPDRHRRAEAGCHRPDCRTGLHMARGRRGSGGSHLRGWRGRHLGGPQGRHRAENRECLERPGPASCSSQLSACV